MGSTAEQIIGAVPTLTAWLTFRLAAPMRVFATTRRAMWYPPASRDRARCWIRPSCFAGGYSEIQCTTTPQGHWSWTSRARWFDFA